MLRIAIIPKRQQKKNQRLLVYKSRSREQVFVLFFFYEGMYHYIAEHILTIFIKGGNSANAIVAESAKYLDKSFLVGSKARDGVVKLPGVIMRQRRH